MRRLLLLLIAATMALPAVAWGPKGHDVVAYIAECHLSKRTRRHVEDTLGGKSMVSVANWMDNASHTDDYAHTKTWHYVNVDADEQSYAASRKEAKGDAVKAIDDIVARLKSGELTAEEERVELMMLIHIVGDMHCPMHAGHKSDLGGNTVKVKFFGKQQKLHSVWDSEIVESAHRWSYTEWQQQIDRLSQEEIDEICKGTVEDWFAETVAEAQKIYEEIPEGKNLSYDEVAYYAPVVERQLLKAGVRLAFLLEEIYK